MSLGNGRQKIMVIERIKVEPETVEIYIPSYRMRKILKDYFWFDRKGEN